MIRLLRSPLGPSSVLLGPPRSFVGPPRRRRADVDAWLLSRTRTTRTPDEARVLVEDIGNVIRERAADPWLYLWLAAAHEMLPEGRRTALGCYHRAIAFAEPGAVADRAQAGIDRLASAGAPEGAPADEPCGEPRDEQPSDEPEVLPGEHPMRDF